MSAEALTKYTELMVEIDLLGNAEEERLNSLLVELNDLWGEMTHEEQDSYDRSALAVIGAPESLGLEDVAVELGSNLFPRQEIRASMEELHIIKYLDLLITLHKEMCINGDSSPAAEYLRAEMDKPWYALTKEQHEIVRYVSERLYEFEPKKAE